MFTEDINNFILEQKGQHKALVTFKDELKKFVPMKQQQVLFYHEFYNFLKSYEDLQDQEQNQSGDLRHIKLLKQGPRGDLKENLEMMTRIQKNSFIHIRNWVKGEVYSLEALVGAINYKDYIKQLQQKCQKDIMSLNEDIVKLNAGKFTFGGMFKNTSEK